MSIRSLGDLLMPRPADMPIRSWGKVVALTTVPNALTVKLSGAPTNAIGVRYLASYTPTVGDVVVVDQLGTDLLVLGKLA